MSSACSKCTSPLIVIALLVLAPLIARATMPQEVPGNGHAPQTPSPDIFRKSSPEHEVLQRFTGTWDATIEYYFGQKQPVSKSTGVEVCDLVCNGRWLSLRFDDTTVKNDYQEIGILGWDPARKKYVGSLADSVMGEMLTLEGTLSEDRSTLTLTGEIANPLMPGARTELKLVAEFKDKGTRLLTVTSSGVLVMKGTYQARKKQR